MIDMQRGQRTQSSGGQRALRIALLTDGVYPYVLGGMQRHSRLLAENLAAAGVDVTLYHTALADEAIEAARAGVDRASQAWRSIDVRFVEHPRPGRYPGHYLRDCWRYSECLLESFVASATDVDFIYAQGLTGLAFVRAKRRGVALPPIGVNAHGYHMFQDPGGLSGWLVQWLYAPTFVRMSRGADFVFTFSDRVRDIVENRLRIPPERVLDVPNAIDDSWIRPAISPCQDRRRFLFVGRHDRLKGLPELQRAIARGRLGGVDFHFIGPIPESRRLRLPNCTYHGSITDTAQLQRIFDASDVLLCPSFAEGMPTVILEALARGLVVIATDVGAVRSMVDTSNGIVLDRPEPAAIENAIRRIAETPDEVLLAMKRASLAKAPRFGWRAVTACTIDAVHHALGYAAQRHGEPAA